MIYSVFPLIFFELFVVLCFWFKPNRIISRSSAFHRQTEAQKNKPPESSTQASACLILRAERTVNSVLKVGT